MRKNKNNNSSAVPTVTVLRRLPGTPFGMNLQVTGLKLDPIQIADLPEVSAAPQVNYPTAEIFKVAKATNVLDLIITQNGLVFVTSPVSLEPFLAQVQALVGSIMIPAA